MALLRFIIQGRSKIENCSKPLMGLLNSWNPTSSNSCFFHSIGSSIPNLTSDFTNNPHLNAFLGGTCIYQGAKQDEWIISLAKFSVTRHNQNQLWRNLMEVLVWNCVHDYFSAIGIKSGDLKLHEAVMLSVNQKTAVLPQI